jgi:hypothetical protein
MEKDRKNSLEKVQIADGQVERERERAKLGQGCTCNSFMINKLADGMCLFIAIMGNINKINHFV